MARFLIESSREDDFSSVALAPVYLRGPEESMEWVKETGAMLLELEKKGYLTLDYDYPWRAIPTQNTGSQTSTPTSAGP